jgi:hypothetical protein
MAQGLLPEALSAEAERKKSCNPLCTMARQCPSLRLSVRQQIAVMSEQTLLTHDDDDDDDDDGNVWTPLASRCHARKAG